MKATLFLFTLLAAAAAQAAPVPPSQLPPGRTAGAPQPQRVPGVSEAGNAILMKAQSTPDTQLIGLLKQQKGIHDQLVSAIMASNVDTAKVMGLLKQQEGVSTQLRQRQDERLMAVVNQLPPADRGVFLRALITPPGAPGPR